MTIMYSFYDHSHLQIDVGKINKLYTHCITSERPKQGKSTTEKVQMLPYHLSLNLFMAVERALATTLYEKDVVLAVIGVSKYQSESHRILFVYSVYSLHFGLHTINQKPIMRYINIIHRLQIFTPIFDSQQVG